MAIFRGLEFSLTLVILFSIANAYVISDKRPIVTFEKGIRDHILLAIGKCVDVMNKAYEYLSIIRQGKYRLDDDFQKFIHCGFRESGFAFEDGTVDVEKSAPLYPDPKAMIDALKPCHGKTGKTPVETTFEYFKCFQERSPYLIGP